jgi:hypothetical protein
VDSRTALQILKQMLLQIDELNELKLGAQFQNIGWTYFTFMIRKEIILSKRL